MASFVRTLKNWVAEVVDSEAKYFDLYAKLSNAILYRIFFAECMCTVQQKEHDCACCDGPLDFVKHDHNEFDET